LNAVIIRASPPKNVGDSLGRVAINRFYDISVDMFKTRALNIA